MRSFHCAALVVPLLAGCQTYAPAPVDLVAHAREFADRLPDATAVREFARSLRDVAPAPFDLADGLGLEEARFVALLFNPELRAARLDAGIAKAAVDHAGRWADPELSGSFLRILEGGVSHPWVVSGSIALTLPITGRPGLEKELAAGKLGRALAEARLAEARVLNRLDATWARWSAAKLSVGLLSELAQRLAELEGVAARLADRGVLTRIEARTFTLARVARQAEATQAAVTVEILELQLKDLLGVHPARPLAFVAALAATPRIPDAQGRLQLLASSPGVALAAREHDVAERQLALAIRKQWPELTLLPTWEEEEGQPRAGLGFSLPIPLWNGNAREIAEARAAREAAAEKLRGSLEVATQALARAEVQVRAATARRKLLEAELLPLAELQLTDVRRLAELGQLDTLLMLDAVTRSYEARLSAVTAAAAEAETTVELNSLFWPALAVGEGD